MIKRVFMIFSVLLFLYFKYPSEKGGAEIKEYSWLALTHEWGDINDEPEDILMGRGRMEWKLFV